MATYSIEELVLVATNFSRLEAARNYFATLHNEGTLNDVCTYYAQGNEAAQFFNQPKYEEARQKLDAGSVEKQFINSLNKKFVIKSL